MNESFVTDENRKRLERFVSKAPVFYQPWWLEALAPGRWDYAIVWRGEEIAAALPYVKGRGIGGTTVLEMPKLTQSLGPWLRPTEAKYARMLSEQKKLMTELIEALPPHDFFVQKFHPDITNWLPFHWQGFSQTTRYTYQVAPLSDLDAVWKGFVESIRREIRKAENRIGIRVVDDLGVDAFLDINEKTFERQNDSLHYSREEVQRMDAACAERDARKILFAVDPDERIHAAVYLVHSPSCAYYIMGGGDAELRTSGAHSLLIWKAIEYAATVSETFDFNGSMIDPIERFFRSFGARQTPIFQVSRDRRSPLIKAGIAAYPYMDKMARKLKLKR